MIHITLAAPGSRPADDPLGRTFHGWRAEASTLENWENNRGDWVLGARADRENYVIFSYQGRVVMAAEITGVDPSPTRPGRKILQGNPLTSGHSVYDRFVDGDTPVEVAGNRNPITYFDAAVGGRPCECGCGDEIYSGRFVRGHEQTALHQRVGKIGRVTDFLDWFDAVYQGGRPPVVGGITISSEGCLEVIIEPDGRVNLSFVPKAT